MRNVIIWKYEDVDGSMPPFVRMFVYKGVKRTLNEFLYPTHILRDSQLAPRKLDEGGHCPWFNGDIKGQVVLMGYSSEQDLVTGNFGNVLVVCNTHDQAIHWLLKNSYQFYGEESDKKRARKVKAVDHIAITDHYIGIARKYAAKQLALQPVLIQPCTIENAVNKDPDNLDVLDIQVVNQAYEYKARADEVLLPRARKVVDNSDLDELLDSAIRKEESPGFEMKEPVDRSVGQGTELPPTKKSLSKKTFLQRIMGFMRVFGK